jgi:hypothetical protein
MMIMPASDNSELTEPTITTPNFGVPAVTANRIRRIDFCSRGNHDRGIIHVL